LLHARRLPGLPLAELMMMQSVQPGLPIYQLVVRTQLHQSSPFIVRINRSNQTSDLRIQSHSMSSREDYYSQANAAASSIARRLKDLRNYQLPRLKDCRDASLQADIASEMKDDLELTARTVEVSSMDLML